MKEVIKDLGEGLVLRRGTIEDVEALVKLHDDVQKEGEWTRSLVDGSHPNTDYKNFIMVEDTNKNIPVSSLGFIPQTWTYGGKEFSVWRVDMVSTLPEYRGRGLIREQMDFVHKLSKDEGNYVQVIVGRPWFYRKFGYSMALRYWKEHQVFKKVMELFVDKSEEKYKVRVAGEADIAFCASLFKKTKNKYSVTCVYEENNWKHEMVAIDTRLAIIENSKGEAVGAFAHSPSLEDSFISVYRCEVDENISWLEVTPCVLKYLNELGKEDSAKQQVEFSGFNFNLMDQHPIYRIFDQQLELNYKFESPFAWYVRIGDMAKFLGQVAPILETRIKNSIIIGYTGTLEISFYSVGSGLVLSFDNGKLILAENREIKKQSNAFPIELFKQLIFGYKSLEELRAYSPEIQVTNEVRIVLDVLFPKEDSFIRSVW